MYQALHTSDANAGLVEAIGANLPGAVWQRCRTHYAANTDECDPEEHVAGGERVCPLLAASGSAIALH